MKFKLTLIFYALLYISGNICSVTAQTIKYPTEVKALYDAADKEPIAPEDITKVEKDSRDEVEEASSAPMMAQPIDGGSLFEIDSLRQKLATTEAILAQNRKCLEETKQERNELYDYAAKQIEELTEEYEGRLKEEHKLRRVAKVHYLISKSMLRNVVLL